MNRFFGFFELATAVEVDTNKITALLCLKGLKESQRKLCSDCPHSSPPALRKETKFLTRSLLRAGTEQY